MLHESRCQPTNAYSSISALHAGPCSVQSREIAAYFARMPTFGARLGNQKALNKSQRLVTELVSLSVACARFVPAKQVRRLEIASEPETLVSMSELAMDRRVFAKLLVSRLVSRLTGQ